jgi:hypothetical protein
VLNHRTTTEMSRRDVQISRRSTQTQSNALTVRKKSAPHIRCHRIRGVLRAQYPAAFVRTFADRAVLCSVVAHDRSQAANDDARNMMEVEGVATRAVRDELHEETARDEARVEGRECAAKAPSAATPVIACRLSSSSVASSAFHIAPESCNKHRK